MIYDLNTEEYGKNSFPSLNRFYYAQELTFGFSGRHMKDIAIRYLWCDCLASKITLTICLRFPSFYTDVAIPKQ